MCQDSLIISLVKNKIISKNTKIEVEVNVSSYTGTGKAIGEFLINKLLTKNNRLVLELVEPVKNQVVTVYPSQIISIDGMEPALLADAYDYMPNGEKKKLGKRRGRPKKIRTSQA